MASDQRGLIQRKHWLIRKERILVGDFHQTFLERSKGLPLKRGAIRNSEMAAMMMRGAIMIFAAIRQAMMMLVLMGLSAAFTISMDISVHYSRRHSCENAESQKLFEEKCHAFG